MRTRIINPAYTISGTLAILLAISHEWWGKEQILVLLATTHSQLTAASLAIIWHQQAASLAIMGIYLIIMGAKPRPSRTASKLITTLLSVQYAIAILTIIVKCPDNITSTFPQLLLFAVMIMVLYFGQEKGL